MSGLTTRQLANKRERAKKAKRRGQLQPGDVLQERYRIVGTLGVGGFSSVYQARDLRFHSVTRLCAVKEMVNTAPDPQMRELANKSFEREASILATLEHPAIPDVYDYFSEGDRSYLILEFIRGKDLEALIEDQTDFLDQETVLDWALQICDVLSYLHNHKPQPVIFRDMKPSNVMLDPQGRIRLIDFGIAKVFEAGEKGTMIGTEGYSPPEQYRGEASPAGDVYALGATLHHLLTRRDPRMEPPFSFGERLISDTHPKISPAFEAIIMRCLAYNVKERFPDADALHKALKMVSRPKTGQLRPEELAVLDGDKPPDEEEAAAGKHKRAAGIQPIWTFKCEDEIRSTPVYHDGLVLVSAYDNNVYAINAQDGQFAWKYATSDGLGASPCVYNDAVFIGSTDGHLYSIQLRYGRLNWQFQAGGPIYSSPKADFDHVFFGADDGFLYALSIATGRMAWKSAAHSAIRSSPYVADEHIFFGSEGGYVFCLDLAGQQKWQFEARRAVTSSPTLADDILYVGSLDHTVYALDAASGWAIWRFRAARPIISSPTIHKGVIYIGSADGHLYALDANSGRKLWAYKTEGQVSCTPAVWQDIVYFSATDGYVYAVGQKRGKLRWRFKIGGLLVSSPTVVDGILYIGSTDHKLYALPA